MGGFIIDNPIAWAHLQNKGGWKRFFILMAGTIGVLGAAIILTMSFGSDVAYRKKTMMGDWTGGLLAIQALVLLMFATQRVGADLRRDVKSGILESHRLMPVPASHGVMGYIIGPATSALPIAAGIFLLGLGTCAAADWVVSGWLMANAMLLVTAFCLATVLALAAIHGHGIFWVVFLVFAIFWVSQGELITMVPAISVLASPIVIGLSSARTGPGDQLTGWIIGMLALLAIALICFYCTCRKYRYSGAIAMMPRATIPLLAVWAATSWLGITFYDLFLPEWFFRYRHREIEGQTITSLALTLLIGLLPLSAAVRIRMNSRQAITLVLPTSAKFDPVTWTILAVALLPVLLTISIADAMRFSMPVAMLASEVVFVVGAYFWLFLLQSIFRRPLMLIVLWVLFTWLGPLGIDLIRISSSSSYDEHLGIISTLSPLGLWIQAYATPKVDLQWGLVGQVVLAIVPIVILSILKRRRNKPNLPTQDLAAAGAR